MKNREAFRIFLLIGIILFFSVQIFAQDTRNSVVRTMNDSDLQWGACPDFMPEGCEITVLNGDPAEPNADILFKVPANSEIPNHTHTSAERMILLSGEMEVAYEGEEPKILKTGSYAYGPSKKPHTARCGDSGPCVLYIAFEDPVDAYVVKE